tara:strand:+ start:5976 stop:6236 length:261 start_codon:yes stop_codon:yes gene_type:complete
LLLPCLNLVQFPVDYLEYWVSKSWWASWTPSLSSNHFGFATRDKASILFVVLASCQSLFYLLLAIFAQLLATLLLYRKFAASLLVT